MGVNASKKGKKSKQGTKSTTPGLRLTDASSSDEDFNQGTAKTSNSETQDAENGKITQIGAAQVTPEELLKTAEEVGESSRDKNDGQVSDDSKHLMLELAEQTLTSIDLLIEDTSKNRDGQTSSSEVSSEDEPDEELSKKKTPVPGTSKEDNINNAQESRDLDEANKKGKDSTGGWVKKAIKSAGKKIKQGITGKNKKKVSEKTRAQTDEIEIQPSTEIITLREEVGKQIDELIQEMCNIQSRHLNVTDLKLEEENPTARKKLDSPDLGSLSGILQYTKGGLDALKNNDIISTVQDKSQLKEIKEEFQKATESYGKVKQEKSRQPCNDKEVQRNLLQNCKCVIEGIQLTSGTPEGTKKTTNETKALKNIDTLFKQLDTKVSGNETEQSINGTTGRSSGSQPKRLQQTQAQVDEVVDIMRVNVDKVLERDQKLSKLDGRANTLQACASQFEKSAKKLKRKSWWENNKKALTLTTLVLGCALGGLAAWFWYKYIETKDLPAAPSLLAVQKNLLIIASVFTGVAFLAFGVFLSSICCPSSCITCGSGDRVKVASCEVSSIH